MSINELIEKLKVYSETQKQNKIAEKSRRLQEGALKDAFRDLDANSISELVSQGVDIRAYDKKSSLYLLAVDSFEQKLFNIFRKKGVRFDEYFELLRTSELEDLSTDVQASFMQLKTNLLQVLELLYQLGIAPSITENENCKESILYYYIANLDILKAYEIFAFFIDKPEVIAYLNSEYNDGLTSSLIRNQSKLSTVILKDLLDCGLKPVSNDNLAKSTRTVAPDSPDLINPILECLAFAGSTKKEKMDLIFPLMPEHLQEKYKASYEELKDKQI